MKLLIGFTAVVAVLTVQAAPAQQLTARQLFYQSEPEAKPSAPAKPVAKAPAPPRKSAPRKKSTAAKPAPKPESPAIVPAVEAVSADQPAPRVESAAYVTARPLGLRYSLVRVSPGSANEVDPNSVFHSGDMVRVKVEGNRDGYLYVIARGSSGTWKPLFPSPEINGGNNRIAAHRGLEVPSATQAFTFDQQAGEERLFIIYSADPVADVEALIPSLPQAKPPAKLPEGAGPEVVAMAKPIDDDLVSRMRNVYSRDLIVQTVDAKQPDGPRPENAVYVVNNSGGRCVADIRLEHR